MVRPEFDNFGQRGVGQPGLHQHGQVNININVIGVPQELGQMFTMNRGGVQNGFQGSNILGMQQASPGGIIVGGQQAYGGQFQPQSFAGNGGLGQMLAQVNQLATEIPNYIAQMQRQQQLQQQAPVNGQQFQRQLQQQLDQVQNALNQLRELSQRTRNYDGGSRSESGRTDSEGNRLSRGEQRFQEASGRISNRMNKMIDAVENGDTTLNDRDGKEFIKLLRQVKNSPTERNYDRLREFIRRHDEDIPDEMLTGLNDRFRQDVRAVHQYKVDNGLGGNEEGRGRTESGHGRRTESGHGREGSRRAEGGHGSESSRRTEDRGRTGEAHNDDPAPDLSAAPTAARQAAARAAEQVDRENLDRDNIMSPNFLRYLESRFGQFSSGVLETSITEEKLVSAISAYNRDNGERNGFIDPERALENFGQLRDAAGTTSSGITIEDVQEARKLREAQRTSGADRELSGHERERSERQGVFSPQFLKFLRDNWQRFAPATAMGLGNRQLNEEQLRRAVNTYNQERGERQGRVNLENAAEDFDRLRRVSDDSGVESWQGVRIEDVNKALQEAEAEGH